MRYYQGDNIAHIFEEVLIDLKEDPDFITSPRGMEVREIRDCSMEIDQPMLNLYKNEFRSSKLKYTAAETLWYLSGTNNPEFIENYAKMWKTLHNSNIFRISYFEPRILTINDWNIKIRIHMKHK